MSTNEVIAYKRFTKAFNEIKIYRQDHYKCDRELKELKHKMKAARRAEDQATMNETKPLLKEQKEMVCPAAKKALNDAVVSAK